MWFVFDDTLITVSDALCSAGVIFLCHMKDKKEPNHTHKAKILYSEKETTHLLFKNTQFGQNFDDSNFKKGTIKYS